MLGQASYEVGPRIWCQDEDIRALGKELEKQYHEFHITGMAGREWSKRK